MEFKLLLCMMLIAASLQAEDKPAPEKPEKKVEEKVEKKVEELPKYKTAALKSINDKRQEWGRQSLKFSKELNKAADDHAEWMASHGMSHTGVNNSRPYHRVQWAKYPGSFTGEIIAVAKTQSQTVRMWVGSPPHFGIMISSGAKEVGISCGENANGTRYWVAVFGRPKK